MIVESEHLKDEIEQLKIELAQTKELLKVTRKLAKRRAKEIIRIKKDLAFFGRQWLICFRKSNRDWRVRAKAIKDWFEYCCKVLPQSSAEITEELKKISSIKKEK